MTASSGWYPAIASSFLFQCSQLSPSQIPRVPYTEFPSIHKVASVENEEPSLLWPRKVTCPSFVPLIWWAACHLPQSLTLPQGNKNRVSFQLFLLDIFLHLSSLTIFFTLKLFCPLCPYWIHATSTSRSHCPLLPPTHSLPTDLGNFLLLCKSLCFPPLSHDFSTKWDKYLNCCCSRVHGDGEMNATIPQFTLSSGDRLQTTGRMNRDMGSPQGKSDPQLFVQNPASELTLYMHFLDISLVLWFYLISRYPD